MCIRDRSWLASISWTTHDNLIGLLMFNPVNISRRFASVVVRRKCPLIIASSDKTNYSIRPTLIKKTRIEMTFILGIFPAPKIHAETDWGLYGDFLKWRWAGMKLKAVFSRNSLMCNWNSKRITSSNVVADWYILLRMVYNSSVLYMRMTNRVLQKQAIQTISVPLVPCTTQRSQ